jgi:hypothetical protein
VKALWRACAARPAACGVRTVFCDRRGKLLNKKKAQRTLKWGCFAPDLIKLKNLRANMNSGRLTIDKEQLDNLTKRVYINV